ncbi:2502_t:CDS:10 [Paraglomus occultum]|uniref:2502_t:CDS:1 n=1 Tax=Paraglomus occultum TaxID=144539 RepID=A0A9N8W6A9_9GLOM|nr:2502_t:CDS:10 [Paraglomus occultum]
MASHPLEIYVKGTKVWLTDDKEGWVSGELVTKEVNGEKVKLTFKTERGKEVDVNTTTTDGNLPPLRNPPMLEAVDDLTSLSYLNEPAVLHTIRTRYYQRTIYTYSGIVLIATNPFQPVSLYSQDIIQAYSGKKPGELEPHVFAIAEDAYRCMIRDQKNQTIVVSGESGAGKTQSAKYIMRYFASVDDKERPVRKKVASSGSGMSEVEEQILATNPIMESFGNAKTTRNDNSSRFGKYLEIQFDNATNIIGAKIRTYLLERSRLVYQPEAERNYHIFYQLCAGAPPSEKKNLDLGDYSQFHYLRQGGQGVIQGVNDKEEFGLTQKALSIVGITIETQWQIFKLCAALLHIGNINITAVRDKSMVSESDTALITATRLLGINRSEFAKWIVKKQISTRNEKIVTDLNAQQATVVRDSVAKYIYANLFDWLVNVVNESLSGEEVAKNLSTFIGVLDIYGFEHFKKNSFEQFCINYANEKLQQQFNQHVFKLEQEDYVREQINWTFIEFSDNQPCIDMIEGKIGILSLLDEDSRMPGGSDAVWCTKLYQNFNTPQYKKYFQKPRFSNSAFTVSHYAHDVTYDVEGFLEKNRDTVPDEHLNLLKNTEFDFLEDVLTKGSAVLAPAAKPADGKRSSVISKKPTLGTIFKASLISLMETINSTNVHYIRCIKPNEAKVAWEFEPQMVLSQLRACGVLETIRISCAGYPSRLTFDELVQRYYMLVHSDNWIFESRKLCSLILDSSIKEQDKYQIGITKIFFRAGMVAFLEKLRQDRLNECVTLMQKNMLRHMHQKRYQALKSAIVKTQALCRKRLAIKERERLRREKGAITIQKNWRAQKQRQRYLCTKSVILKLQTVGRGVLARRTYETLRREAAAIKIQKVYRGCVARRQYKDTLKHIIFIQSCLRRRMARSELKKLKIEARSASHYKEVSYRLENKVIELTQSLEQKIKENKTLEARNSNLESQVRAWTDKNEKLELEFKTLKRETEMATVSLSGFKTLQEENQTIEARYRTSLEKIKAQDTQIENLTNELNKKDDEVAKLRTTVSKYKGTEDPATVLALKQEIAALREQLTKLKTSGRGMSPPPPQQRLENGFLTAANTSLKPPSTKRRGRRHSSAESWGPNEIAKQKPKTSLDLATAEAKKGGLRPVSVSYMQPVPKLRSGGRIHLPGTEEPEEEIMKMLEDEDSLDDEVINGLITSLKIPLPSLQNPPHKKEILFPARLISLLAQQMWKFGFIKESERLFANVMKTIQSHVMDTQGEDAILPGAYWLSNVHELLSFAASAENDMLAGVNPAADAHGRVFEWHDYERLVSIVKHDLESLEYNIYHTWMKELKKRLYKMVIPAVVESQSLPGFITTEGRLFTKFIGGQTSPAFSMDDLLNFLNKVWKAMKSYYVEMTVIQQVVTELLKLIDVTSAHGNEYNMTRIEEWCKSHEMPEGTLQLEHLMQATKLLQLKKASLGDIEIIYDVCWILTPTQIQKLISHYFVADYENPISPEILKAVASRVVANDKNDILLLDTTPLEDSGPFEVPAPRQAVVPENYMPAWLNLPHVKRISALAIR